MKHRIPWTLVAAVAVAGWLAVEAPAQQGAPAFEVISVKPHKPDDNRREMPRFLPGRFSSVAIPLRFVIAAAYDVGFQSVRLTGGPEWIQSMDGSYDIEATAPKGALPPGLPDNLRSERLRLMLQGLLAERFKLKIRRETKEMPVYAVVVGKGGAKLQKSKIEEKDCRDADTAAPPDRVACHAFLGGRGRGLHGEAVSIADMLGYVENWTDRPLVDKTGLPGLFNIQTRGWLPMQPGPAPAAGVRAEDGSDMADVPTLFGVFEGLGLKLEAQRGAVEVFVIERVERATEN